MSSFEHEMTLGEFGIELPDRCKTCPRLGGMVTKLGIAQENKNFLTTASDEEVLVANMESQLTEQVRARYPDATDEQVTDSVRGSIARHLDSDTYIDFLQQTSELLEIEDDTVNATLAELTAQISSCPPTGCSSL